MTESEFRTALAESGLALARELDTLARPAIELVATPVDQPLHPRSHIGGFPNLPASFEWPTWQGMAHEFVAEIQLADLPYLGERELLPPNGRLLFFYAQDALGEEFPDALGSWHVSYTSAAPSEAETRVKLAEPGLYNGRPAFPIEFRELWTIPTAGSSLLRAEEVEWKRVRSWCRDLYVRHQLPIDRHQMFGWQRWFQFFNMQLEERECLGRGLPRHNKLPTESLVKEIEQCADDWVLLLMVSDESIRGGMVIGDDVGCLFFWVRREALKRLDFSQVYLCMESH